MSEKFKQPVGSVEDVGRKTEIGEKNMFGISYDPKRERYIVRLLVEKGKPFIYKEFSVSKHGDQKRAKQEAIKYRNEQVVNWLIPCQRTREAVDLQNNKTGVTGVHRRVRNGNRIYVATWYDESNKLQRMQFSENRWTPRQAFFMAWATRIAKQKIFKKNKETREFVVSPNKCFDIVYNEIGEEKAEEIRRNMEKGKTELHNQAQKIKQEIKK